MASDVGDDLGLDDLVYVTLGIESTIKHDQVRPTLTVYPSPNHETATSPSVLLRNADVSITLTPATPYSDTPIIMSPGLALDIFKMGSWDPSTFGKWGPV